MDEPSVTAEDQAQLNTFSRLSETLSIYEPRLAEAQREATADALSEAEVFAELEEPSHIRIKIGDGFAYLPPGEALAMLSERLNDHSSKCDELRRYHSALASEASALKTLLYAKFRGAINLER
ncbi:hypothetical protein DI09_1p50 [Mitosporidium daphniae]|uniref:Prefoldin subunit 4 n=1 Tax=Mitosporidium daphniae TaxID=1485682 RepID=A0A098VT45_9MICR|nr:uncharacterized protein DI09_91p50 [Mitosporidium daphniae]XP_013238650.1 uncharacterized protein DI09_1p50 [Mitosporidium daphniae]KGG50044.1 hypothetical protein DI09_91p50 [Mitosporidium daphniae]KGG52155.1 hypothetical protein DI09_1p50 [Mitosporidium daphniae]|eukprot:XP_013236480.1 uncharacterized protein DI09_91p50 [Mitosporidium daphniae]